jgi:hypothetical protein
LRVSKHLLDSAELKAIGRFDGEIRRFLYNICLPFEIGIHLLPIAALKPSRTACGSSPRTVRFS